MTILEAHDQARALRRLAVLATNGNLRNARKAITRTAARLLISGLLGSEGRALCEDAIWACKEAA